MSGQMHGGVFLGDGEKPLRPALLWNDQRTAEQCAEIESKAGGREKLIEMVAESRAHRLHRAEDPLGPSA